MFKAPTWTLLALTSAVLVNCNSTTSIGDPDEEPTENEDASAEPVEEEVDDEQDEVADTPSDSEAGPTPKPSSGSTDEPSPSNGESPNDDDSSDEGDEQPAEPIDEQPTPDEPPGMDTPQPPAPDGPSDPVLPVLPAEPVMQFDDWPFSSEEAKSRQQATAEELGVPVEYSLELDENTTLEFVLIPAGRSVLGSPEGTPGWEPDERIREVTVDHAFYLGKYHFTREQYRAVMGHYPENDPTAFLKMSDSPNEPALAPYHVLRDELLPLLREKAPEGWAIRLPDEFEWEHAARAGTATLWYTGDTKEDLAKIAWFNENSDDRLHDVGLLEPNAWGLYDMIGNAWHYYFKADGWNGDTDPAPEHLVKGGCYMCEAFGNGCRTSNFGIWTFGGFRFALEPH